MSRHRGVDAPRAWLAARAAIRRLLRRSSIAAMACLLLYVSLSVQAMHAAGGIAGQSRSSATSSGCRSSSCSSLTVDGCGCARPAS